MVGTCPIRESAGLRLAPFTQDCAADVAAWAPSPEALRWLAPGTEPPLTGPKVLAWIKPHTRAFLLGRHGDPHPVGYGEINPMRADPRHFWLGHIIVDPAMRGCGLGTALVKRLLDVGRFQLGASHVSLIVFPENHPAIRCYELAGFDRAGEETHTFAPHGGPVVLWRYEWRA